MTRRAPNKGSVFRPAPYEDIQCNAYLGRHRKSLLPHEVAVCQCQPVPKGSSGCSEACFNRQTNQECNAAYCPCGPECSNQQIQRHQGARTRLQHMGTKGWGLVAAQIIPANSFVIEYIGEVVSAKQAAQRTERYEAEDQPHTYFMNISANEIIDATKRGNRARFINHSCEPNCETQKWLVNGETCVCIFSLREIAAGEELTYDYHLKCCGVKRVRCQCGAPSCTGYLGQEIVTASEEDIFGEVDGCLAAGPSNTAAALDQAGPACGIFTLSNGVLRQASDGTPMPCTGKVHSPDSSATVTGEPCSDASDLTSSHHETLQVQKLPKRIRLSAENPNQALQNPEHATQPQHARANGAPGPSQQQQQQQQHQQPGSRPSTAAGAGTEQQQQQQQHLMHCKRARTAAHSKQSFCSVDEHVAPPYTPCIVPGLSPAQQQVKNQEEQQLAHALRQQQNLFQVGYDMDEYGGLKLPEKPHPRTFSMKFVFAQRWTQQQQQQRPAVQPSADAAQLSMQQLLMEDDAVVLHHQRPCPLPSMEMAPDGHGAGVAVPYQNQHYMMAGSSAAAKLPVRFQLSQAKHAMRKAESGSPQLAPTLSSSTQLSTLEDGKHAAWQLDQLANSSAVNDPFLEDYVDRQNEDFDSIYWSMLETLSGAYL